MLRVTENALYLEKENSSHETLQLCYFLWPGKHVFRITFRDFWETGPWNSIGSEVGCNLVMIESSLRLLYVNDVFLTPASLHYAIKEERFVSTERVPVMAK